MMFGTGSLIDSKHGAGCLVPVCCLDIHHCCRRFLNVNLTTPISLAMDMTRCPKCKKRLMAMIDRTGRTDLRCLKCDKVDPLKNVAVEWKDTARAKASAQP